MSGSPGELLPPTPLQDQGADASTNIPDDDLIGATALGAYKHNLSKFSLLSAEERVYQECDDAMHIPKIAQQLKMDVQG